MHSHHDHDHEHGHDHGHGHSHDYKSVALQRLTWSLAITFVVMLAEIAGGVISGSIALISDAGHMLTHAFAIGISVFAILIARKPRCHHRTFGLLRAEVLAALVNGIFLMLVSLWIVIEATQRFFNPLEIVTSQMLIVAILGLLVNVISIFLLEGSRKGDMNVHSVFLHMIGDAASSVAIVIAAVIIHFNTGLVWLDPAISIAIALWISVWAIGLLKDSARVLLEMAPKGRNVHEIMDAMRKEFPEIVDSSNEHVWTITQEVIVFSAHLQVDPAYLKAEKIDATIKKIEQWLADKYEVAESTLQLHSAAASPCESLSVASNHN